MSVVVVMHEKDNYPNRDEASVGTVDLALELLRTKHALCPLEERYDRIEIVVEP